MTALPKGRNVRSDSKQSKCKADKTVKEDRKATAGEKVGTREAHSKGELNERKAVEAKPR